MSGLQAREENSMKTACCFLLLGFAAAGCVELPLLPNEKPKPSAQAAHPAGPMTADQVTEANAHEKAEALRQELDRDIRNDQRAGAGDATSSR
jgi:hypothetical protein